MPGAATKLSAPLLWELARNATPLSLPTQFAQAVVITPAAGSLKLGRINQYVHRVGGFRNLRSGQGSD
jgi:hypothetical protein